jgi:hypothetical protein
MTDFNVRIDCVTNSKYPACDLCECDVSTEVLAGDNVVVDQITPSSVIVNANVEVITQALNGFAIGTPVYFDGTWRAAVANSFATSGTHVVSRVGDPQFRVTQTGVVDFGIPHGLSLGSLLYVSPITPGTFTTTNPTAPYFSNPLAKVSSAETIEVFSYLSQIGLPPLQIFLNPVTGSDANDGLTVGAPVQTLPGAITKFGTNTSGPSNRTATITLSAGTLLLPADSTVDFSPLANIGFTEVIVIGDVTTQRSGSVVTANNTAPASQFTQLITDQVGMGVNAFRGMIISNTTENTDAVVETNTATNFVLPDGRGGNIVSFQNNQNFAVVTLNTNLTWVSGSIDMIITSSMRLTFRYLAITAAGAASDQIRFIRQSAQGNLGSLQVTVTGCSINTATHTAVFNNGAQLNVVGCLVTGNGTLNTGSNATVRIMRVFITNAIVRPISATSGGIYALSQSSAIPFEDGSRVFGCKIENGVAGPTAMITITNSDVRMQGVRILGNANNITAGIAISASTVMANGLDINGNARLGVGMTITRGSVVRIGFSPAGIPNDFSNNRTDGIQVSHGSLLDSGTAAAVTSTTINGTGFGINFSSGSTGIFGVQPTITGASGNVNLGASGARTWAQVAGGLAANVNDFSAASPQNVVVMIAA